MQMTPAREGIGERSALEAAVALGVSSSPAPFLTALPSRFPAPYPGFEGIVLGHVIQQRRQGVDLQINAAHLLPGLKGQGSERPIPVPHRHPVLSEGRDVAKVGGKGLSFPGDVTAVAAPPGPPYLRWELGGGLRTFLLH